MTDSLGRIVAQLAESSETLPPELIDLINRNVKPPEPITAEQVYVRAMYIVSDQINSFGGRFPADEHDRLTQLLVDTPVMIGHRKDRLPIGRTFHAVTVERDNCRWVKSYFYWMRSAESAGNLADNIDGGICKECSIAFTFSFPECSVCGKDIRLCDHEPLREYEEGQTCHFNYRRIERVLETSLVYRGANPDTSVSKDLHAGDNLRLTPIRSFDELNADDTYIIVPSYDSIPVTACLSNGSLRLHHLDGSRLKAFTIAGASLPSTDVDTIVTGLLVGYRGRVRCTPEQLVAWLSDKPAPVTRVVLNILPGRPWRAPLPWSINPVLTVRDIPHRIGTRAHAARLARQIMTRDGVELYRCNDTGVGLLGYHYRPELRDLRNPGTYTVLNRPRTEGSLFYLHDTSGDCYEVRNCDLSLLKAGRRFVAQKRRALSPCHESSGVIAEGQVTCRTSIGAARVYGVNGSLDGRLVCRPVRVSGHDAFAIHFKPHAEESL
jgi:hypothetical protein